MGFSRQCVTANHNIYTLLNVCICMEYKYTTNSVGPNMFHRLKTILSETDSNGLVSGLDESYIQSSLGAMFVTKPLNKNEPFPVDGSGSVDVDGKDFSVDQAQITGGAQSITVKLVAIDKSWQYVYEFSGKISLSEPHLAVEKAEVTSQDGGGGKKIKPTPLA